MTIASAAGVEVRGPDLARFDEVLTGPALEFVASLHREFDPARRQLLHARAERQARLDSGELPEFPSETRAIREGGEVPTPLEESVRNMTVIDALFRSASRGGWEAVSAAPREARP